MKTPIIVALDTNNFTRSKKLVDQLIGETKWFKVGMEAFYSHGEELLSYLESKQANIFLDLKLHDIPSTVTKSLCCLVKRFPMDIINLHAMGGYQMMSESINVVKKISPNTQIIAVTVLTSHDQKIIESELGIKSTIENQVEKLTSVAIEAGCDGVVCSAHEVKRLKLIAPSSFIYVTPGIRLTMPKDDQRRVMTPIQAIQNGSTHLVIGREITNSINPVESIQSIRRSFE